MKLIRNSIFAAAALALSAGVAIADDVMPPTSGPYLSLSGGMNIVDPRHFLLDSTTNASLKYKDGWALFGAAGYKWEQGFRAELEYGHSNNNAKDVNSSAFPVTGAQRDNQVMANVYYDISTGTRLTPYLGGGLGVDWVSLNKIQSAAGGGTVYDGTTQKLAWQGIAGVAYAVAPNWQVTAEYRYRGANNYRYLGNVPGSSISRYADRDHNILVGLRYTFGEPRRVETAAATTQAPPPPAPMARPTPPPAPPAPEKFLVFFDFDKSNLRDDAQKIVAEAADYAKHNGKTVISATGHTDTMGTAAYNMALSERRAHAVQKQLEKLGIPASEIVVHWKGKSEPLVPTGDGVKEPQNRRVEIIFE